MSLKIVCIIPARLKSTRFPRKMLSFLCEKPLLQWVWEAACACSYFQEVYIAVDAVETQNLAESFGAKVIMTDPHCLSGTDRLVEIAQKKYIDADIWVNWQGDEPFITQDVIKDLLKSLSSDPSDVWTLKTKIINSEEIQNPHFAKVVTDHEGYALFFSRSPIPYFRDHFQSAVYKHIGLYAYTKKALQKISSMPPCEIEQAEQLEQLRYLYYGLKIKVHETTSFKAFGIDLPEHLAQAEAYLLNKT